ncbi:MAG: copper amine oxidase N-terminal domain-containing protein [Bacillota bacterium]
MKRKIIMFLCLVLVATLFYSIGAYAGSPIKIVVNGKQLQPDVAPQVIDGRTMVPIRFVAEALGAKVSWDENNNAVVITTDTADPGQKKQFSGSGNDFTEKFTLGEGLVKVNYKHSGEGNFIVWLLDNNGKEIQLISNEIGSCEGKIAFSAKQGVHLVNVQAGGAWSITIEQ